jgi:hypothetical protein
MTITKAIEEKRSMVGPGKPGSWEGKKPVMAAASSAAESYTFAVTRMVSLEAPVGIPWRRELSFQSNF